jgi:predicted acyl esterase
LSSGQGGMREVTKMNRQRSLGEKNEKKWCAKVAVLATSTAFATVVALVTATRAAAQESTKAQEYYEVIVERNASAKMRDGVTLRADIYRPKADGKFPVLLVRTPYDKTNEGYFGMKGAARGYVVVEQDVRGRFASDGEWYTFKNELNDGYDTVEWAAQLPYANGKVGMFGAS